MALEREDGPVALLLTRQGVPVLDRDELGPADALARGAYVLWDSCGAGAGAQESPELILIATGSEVAPALEAARELAGEGVRTRLVSMPCVELFEVQPREYRDQVLPPQVSARLAVEAGASLSWWRWVGSEGAVLGVDRFGASAPGSRVLEEFGFTGANVAARARALLQASRS